MRRQRPCLVCSRLTRNPSRCDTHQAEWQAQQDQRRGSATRRGYDSRYRRTAAATVANHRASVGDWCPGWRRPGHPATDLTADHVVPLAAGGSNTASNLAALCRSCNAAKRDR
ncbi:HNH endonuclease [Kitasatospora mediocidica]|uniref:HNH endonuclease n=1 Tax=Kitasatospora mediocidica TaxID=58352 RepID=UPI00055AD11E|nr:HNH endonuclease signature motif containing protein [Kitasatospora mediocidica]